MLRGHPGVAVFQQFKRRLGVARQRRAVHDLRQFALGISAAFEFGHLGHRVHLTQALVFDRQQAGGKREIVALESEFGSVIDALQHGFSGLDFTRRERQRFHAGRYSIAVMLVATNYGAVCFCKKKKILSDLCVFVGPARRPYPLPLS